MTSPSIRERVQAFKVSSSFAGGDQFSFSVSFGNDIKLPGKFDPSDYLTKIGANLRGKRVCIICPANSGLCVEALSRASEVQAYEPREGYHRAVNAVNSFASETTGRGFKLIKTLDGNNDAFDVVIWSEGVDDIRDPKYTIDGIVRSLAPGGVLYLELSHGTAGAVPAQINSWRPTRDGLVATFKDYPHLRIESEIDGRNQVRKIYTIKDTRTPERSVKPETTEPQVTEAQVELLEKSAEAAPSSDTTSDIEYFRQQLMAGLAKMREPEKPDAGSTELMEVFDRSPEPDQVTGSTPKSRKKAGKESKS